jgi:protein TonB
MFDVLVESTSRGRGARTWAFFAASSAFWLVVLTGVGVAGVMTYDARLDAEFDSVSLVAVLPPAPSRPPVARQLTTEAATSTRFESQVVQAVDIQPPRPHPPQVETASYDGLPVGEGDRQGDQLVEGFGPGVPGRSSPSPHVVPPPPEPAPPEVTPPASSPSRPVSQGPIAGRAIRRVEPPYPLMAKQANISGDVIVEVTVSETGDVQSARVISGHPILRDASLAAAKQWRFSPTLLGGRPVRVIGTITFAFKR